MSSYTDTVIEKACEFIYQHTGISYLAWYHLWSLVSSFFFSTSCFAGYLLWSQLGSVCPIYYAIYGERFGFFKSESSEAQVAGVVRVFTREFFEKHTERAVRVFLVQFIQFLYFEWYGYIMLLALVCYMVFEIRRDVMAKPIQDVSDQTFWGYLAGCVNKASDTVSQYGWKGLNFLTGDVIFKNEDTHGFLVGILYYLLAELRLLRKEDFTPKTPEVPKDSLSQTTDSDNGEPRSFLRAGGSLILLPLIALFGYFLVRHCISERKKLNERRTKRAQAKTKKS